MTKSKKKCRIKLWNPASGECFDKDDESCPLQNIGLLVSQKVNMLYLYLYNLSQRLHKPNNHVFPNKNMYVNIQNVERLCLMNFDLRNKTSWRSFYSHSQTQYLKSIQEETLHYSKPIISLFREITIEIMDIIKAAIREWRRHPSSFDRDISNRLECILDDLEEEKMHRSNKLKNSDCLEVLQNLLGEKSIFGFPLHQSFTNIDNIVKAVERTRIHESKHPDVEFAVAVKIYPYVCGVASVWVFLCSITPG